MSRIKILVRFLAVLGMLIAGALMPPKPALAVPQCSAACFVGPPGPCVCDSSCSCCISGFGGITSC